MRLSLRARSLRALVIRTLALRALAAGAAVALAAPAADAQRDPWPLFASDTALRITLVGDWRALGGDRDTLKPVQRPGTLSYVDEQGRPVRIRVSLSTRGHFRLARANCQFPPLRVAFDSGGTRRTLFANQRALKLGTHCNDTDTYEQYVLREHLSYRAHNLVTDHSFRSRLARVRYVDARDTTRVVERWGRFIESERELARRLGGDILEARGGVYEQIEDSSAALLGLWEYFIGNTDFSLGALHNVRLLTSGRGTLAIPYDFDFSGLVETRYSTPDARLPIKSVRQRLYRGPCLTEAQLVPVLDRFTRRREAILALYDSLPPLDRGYGKRAKSYLEDFFEEARKPGDFARSLRGSCVKGT
jgi:hypothetical protein